MNKKIIFGILACSVSLIGIEEGFGCSCGGASLDTSFQEHDYVFSGFVEKIELNNPPYNDVFVKTDRFWKGIESDNVVVQTHMHGATCGYDFVQNQTYLIFADKSANGILSTELCSGTRDFDNLSSGIFFLLDYNLHFLGNMWIELLIFRLWFVWIPLFLGVVTFFLIRRRSKEQKNLETN